MPTIYKPQRKRTQKNDNYYVAERRKIYNSERWRSLRAWKFACNPLCEICQKAGKTVPAEDVHHITPFMSTNDSVERKRLAYDYDNLMSLCKQCHRNIHNERIR